MVGGERDALDARLATLPAVIAASPAGARFKVLVARGARREVEAARAARGRARAGAPDFEDLFLSRIREAA